MPSCSLLAGRSFGEKERDDTVTTNSNPIRILAVDDNPAFRSGLAALFATQRDVSLVAEACNGYEEVQQFLAHRPDITLMDLNMPKINGLDAMVAIRGEFPDARIIILSTFAGDVEIQGVFQAGACGYILKSLPAREMPHVIHLVNAGVIAFLLLACDGDFHC